MSGILHAIQAPRRREILRLVWSEERSAGDIHRSLGDVTFGAVSQHLRVLERARLVSARREGRRRYYRARADALGPLAEWLESSWRSALQRLRLRAEMEAARRGPDPSRTPRRKRKP